MHSGNELGCGLSVHTVHKHFTENHRDSINYLSWGVWVMIACRLDIELGT